MNLVIVGYGSIAKKHSIYLRSIFPDVELRIVVRDIKGRQNSPDVTFFCDFSTAVGPSTFAIFICSPAPTHLSYAHLALERGELLLELRYVLSLR